jgi:hypothetical protein
MGPAAAPTAPATPIVSPGAPDTVGTAAPSPSPAAGTPRLLGFAFNAGGQDVTLFDVAARQALETRPLGATVRWLSNEQRFWDGRYIWTFDHPDDRVQAIAIDPRGMAIARRVPTTGRGPAHSLMLTPDRKTAWLNVAGDDYLAVIDVESGQVAGQVKTGRFP